MWGKMALRNYSSRFATSTARTQGIGQRGKKMKEAESWQSSQTWPSLAIPWPKLSWAENEPTWGKRLQTNLHRSKKRKVGNSGKAKAVSFQRIALSPQN